MSICIIFLSIVVSIIGIACLLSTRIDPDDVIVVVSEVLMGLMCMAIAFESLTELYNIKYDPYKALAENYPSYYTSIILDTYITENDLENDLEEYLKSFISEEELTRDINNLDVYRYQNWILDIVNSYKNSYYNLEEVFTIEDSKSSYNITNLEY